MANIRLDKTLTTQTDLSRKEAKEKIKRGHVKINNEVCRNASHICQANDQIQWQGLQFSALALPRYFIFNKPADVVCSHVDDGYKTVFSFIDEPNKDKLSIAGRLDADTTGLVLISDDGQWVHRIISPKRHCEKTYRVTTARPIELEYIEQFKEGLELHNETHKTLPAQLNILSENQADLIITEGKYHQIKRMFAAAGNHVEALHRHRIGAISLDSKDANDLRQGEYRALTTQEIALF